MKALSKFYYSFLYSVCEIRAQYILGVESESEYSANQSFLEYLDDQSMLNNGEGTLLTAFAETDIIEPGEGTRAEKFAQFGRVISGHRWEKDEVFQILQVIGK